MSDYLSTRFINFFGDKPFFGDLQKQYEVLLSEFLQKENYESAAILKKEAIAKGLKIK